jgi:hypothetical protein
MYNFCIIFPDFLGVWKYEKSKLGVGGWHKCNGADTPQTWAGMTMIQPRDRCGILSVGPKIHVMGSD